MAKLTKSITYYRSDIGSFEKEGSDKSYLFQIKEYNKDGHLVLESEYRPNGIKELEILYDYDQNQNLLSKHTLYPLEETEEKLVHIFNSNGQKIRDENYFGEDLFETLNYEYDEKGNVISQSRVDEDENEIEKQLTVFDENGKISKQSFYANGDLEREVEFEYNENGICVREKHLKVENNMKETIEYVYNEAGKKTSSTSMDGDNNIIGYIDVEYDESMNPLKYTSETSGFYNSKAINQLTYDEQNRIIENEYFDVLNNFLVSKEKIFYDEEGNIIEEEIFEIKPETSLKKTHYRLQLKYDFYVD